MADATCKTCPAYRPSMSTETPIHKPKPTGRGLCQLQPPTWCTSGYDGPGSINASDYQPSVSETDVCAEHPLHPMQRHRLASRAMAAYAGDPSTLNWTKKETAASAYALADAVLAECAKGAGRG